MQSVYSQSGSCGPTHFARRNLSLKGNNKFVESMTIVRESDNSWTKPVSSSESPKMTQSSQPAKEGASNIDQKLSSQTDERTRTSLDKQLQQMFDLKRRQAKTQE